MNRDRKDECFDRWTVAVWQRLDMMTRNEENEENGEMSFESISRRLMHFDSLWCAWGHTLPKPFYFFRF